jgi:hypothetical protein
MKLNYYHDPLRAPSNRARCPVCHEPVYSRAGIHPQCAVRQSDPPRGGGKPSASLRSAELAAAVPEQPGTAANAPDAESR